MIGCEIHEGHEWIIHSTTSVDLCLTPRPTSYTTIFDIFPIQINRVETDLSTITVLMFAARSENDSIDDLKKLVPRVMTRMYALREMYFMHFSRHSRQQ